MLVLCRTSLCLALTQNCPLYTTALPEEDCTVVFVKVLLTKISASLSGFPLPHLWPSAPPFVSLRLVLPPHRGIVWVWRWVEGRGIFLCVIFRQGVTELDWPPGQPSPSPPHPHGRVTAGMLSPGFCSDVQDLDGDPTLLQHSAC